MSPAALVIDSVVASQSTVTKQQTQNWTVNVHLNNTGGASYDLDAARSADIGFYSGASQQADYIVIPPIGFVSGTPGDWTIASATPRVLSYTVTTTGATTGTIKIQSNQTATDVNDLSALAAEDSTGITVVNPSGLFISITRVDTLTAPNNPQPNVTLVNKQQAFRIEVEVTNTGEAVDTVEVQLTSGGTGSDYATADRRRDHSAGRNRYVRLRYYCRRSAAGTKFETGDFHVDHHQGDLGSTRACRSRRVFPPITRSWSRSSSPSTCRRISKLPRRRRRPMAR